MITQKQAIKSYLKSFGSITSQEAWRKFSITRLSSIILRLRKEGFEIISIPKRNNRFNWVMYRLIRVPKPHTKVKTEFKLELGKV